ncbi:MAG: sirohydrochlorin cobaltochelatase [Lachnospiraceae bacterium]|nr:sirohydrochlorin cobaltochelatase [Lachnospiraceae bacterium]
MKHNKMMALLLAGLLAASMAGCGSSGGAGAASAASEAASDAESAAAQETADAESAAAQEAGDTESAAAQETEPDAAPVPAAGDADSASSEDADRAAADRAAALIDAIYVQTRNENTDAQCAEARAAWDALTDAQKELVEGENADPDYFGLDTGDAASDDPRNGDEIGEKELLVVSFGTSYNESRAQDIGGIEEALGAAYPDWSVRRAFTSQIILNHILARDGEAVDNMDQALQRAADNGVKHLIVQPTHLMRGAEYDELTGTLSEYEDRFESVRVAEPLLGEVGSDASAVNEDKKAVAEAVTAEAVRVSGYDSADAAAEDGTAYVFMGHGTSHTAKVTYDQMQTQMEQLGYGNVFIGTVEGEPEDTSCEAVIGKVKEAGFKKVVLRPLMVVAGDHAHNDMADPEDPESWVSLFTEDGSFDAVDTQIEGLGRIPAIQDLYTAHAAEAMEAADARTADAGADGAAAALADGVYTAAFQTDSGMFRVNEADGGMGTLTVKDGAMTIHIRLTSKNIINLFPGTAEEAKKEGAVLLEPAAEEVTYSDGATEEVNAFDVPVPAVGEEFDLALIGTKGKWYDHRVSVQDPVPQEE